MEKKALFKKAAELLRSQDLTIRQHTSKIDELTEKLASYQRAEEALRTELKFQDYSATDSLKKLAEYRAKSAEEIMILNKAFELVKQGSAVSFFGKVASEKDRGITPEERFVDYLITGEN